jgi:hypothetical protein
MIIPYVDDKDTLDDTEALFNTAHCYRLDFQGASSNLPKGCTHSAEAS